MNAPSTHSHEQIQKFLRKADAAFVFRSALKGICRAVPVAFLAVLVLAGLDRSVEIAAWGRQLLWFLGALGCVFAFASGFYPLSLLTLLSKSQYLAKHGQTIRPDDLRIALELATGTSDGTSHELRERFVADVADRLTQSRAGWCFPEWKWKRPTLILVCTLFFVGALRAFFPAAVPLDGRVLFPFWSYEVERRIRVEPGDAQVPYGGEATIELTPQVGETGKPVLLVKTGDNWLELQPNYENSAKLAYTIKNIVTPLYYRVGLRGSWSRKFALTPVETLAVKKFDVKLVPPAYTGKSASEQTSPELTGLAGTDVLMNIEASGDMKGITLVFSDNREIVAEKISGRSAKFHFVLEKSGSYGFAMNPVSGLPMKAETNYPVNVVPDKAPTIMLLSPDQDVVVGEKEKLPLTFDARDDVGLGQIFLQWETPNGKSNRVAVKSFENITETALATVDWDLSNEKFSQAQVVRFRLEVQDKNKVTGPGVGFSEWRILEIRSFDMEHAVIEKALEAWRNKTVETLAQMTTLDKKMKAENADMSALSKEFDAAAQNMKKLDDVLKEIVSRMEQDPNADYGVWMEHKAIEENLNALNQTTVKNTQAAFQTQNKDVASQNVESLANELERMTALSEDMTKTQKARDVLQSSENLNDIGDSLSSLLEKGGGDESTKQKINQLLSDAQKDLAKMAQALQQMPEELPEDFVNQEALKNLELGKSQDILSQIADAVKNGDMARALDLAKKFSSAVKSMQKQLSKAHESFLESHSASDLSKKIKTQQEALQKVADEQRQILSDTQKLASQQLDEIMKQQEELLDTLAKRQSKVIGKSHAVVQENVNTVPMLSRLAGLQPIMTLVENELKSKRIDKSVDWLTSVTIQTKILRTDIEKSSASVTIIDPVREIDAEELAILSILKDPPAPKENVSAADEKTFQALDARQQELRKKTQSVRQELGKLSRRTASLTPSLMQALGRAGNEMKNASDELTKKNGVVAQRSEERALDNLLEGQSQLDEAMSAMSEMAMQQGEGEEGQGEGGGMSGGRPKVISRKSGNGPGGLRGSQMGKVRLPNADDFRAPKAFREDLMESLKEHYPKVYEDIIQKYYKRLAQ